MMRVLRQTPDELILFYFPVKAWIQALCGVGLFMLIPVVVFLLQSHSRLTCQRLEPNQGSCKLERTVRLDTHTEAFPIQSLVVAQLRKTATAADPVNKPTAISLSYQVVLVTRQGEIPFTSLATSRSPTSQQQSNVDRINQFIQNSNLSSLTVVEDSRSGAAIFLAVAAVFTLFFALIYLQLEGQYLIYRFDRPKQKLIVTRRGFLGTRTQQYDLRQLSQQVRTIQRHLSDNFRFTAAYEDAEESAPNPLCEALGNLNDCQPLSDYLSRHSKDPANLADQVRQLL